MREDQEARIENELKGLHAILGDIIYSDKDDTLESAIGEILKATGKTLSTAESCTGGMISSLITSVPGSSEYFLGSVTSYANSVKENVLGVPSKIIEKYGAVSSECVSAMAEGVRRLTGSDYSVATSGIAGPGGGSDQKPVGTVWIGVSSHMGTETFSLRFNSDRKRNIERFSSSALHILLKRIKNELKH
jgi:nicotinamide-nucleotide amidase